MPTKRRRHAITETPPVQHALDELRRELGTDDVEVALIDNSGWARLANASLPQARADEIADAVEAGLVYVSLPFLLEAGYSARNAGDQRVLMSELRALPHAEIDAEVERRAIDAQNQLARAGHHRMPPVNLLLSSLGERHGLGILHYDRDYDIVRAKTDVAFDSVWLAKPGRCDD